MAYDLFVFDLDGTLVDSLVDIAGALNRAVTINGGQTVPVEVVRTLVGYGVVSLCQRALSLQPRPLATTAVELADDVRRFYEAHPCIAAQLFPGVAQVLTHLAGRPGTTVCVLTNKPGDVARGLLAAAAAPFVFAAVIGDGDGYPRKPDPKSLLSLCTRFGVAPARTLMVGDGLPDVAVGRAAGVATAAALWGYSDAAALQAERPTYMVNVPLDLVALC